MVRHLKPPEGAGYVSLMAFDAATNSSATNFTIYRSHSGLRIDPLPAVSNQLTITVTGYRDRTNYTVWVNEVQAVTQPDGKWKANGVPVGDGGVAIVDASERPIDTNAPKSRRQYQCAAADLLGPGHKSDESRVIFSNASHKSVQLLCV